VLKRLADVERDGDRVGRQRRRGSSDGRGRSDAPRTEPGVRADRLMRRPGSVPRRST
jgi:hypothetical protein